MTTTTQNPNVKNPNRDVIISDTHRGLRYEDGRLTDVLEAGRHGLPRKRWFGPTPLVEIRLVDMREREFTIKGQEILTSDKVAVRVSIVTQFRVTDPVACSERVASYEDRLYSDVQLAARRSLATMTLEAILTNRNQLSEDILAEVTGVAAGYGVAILRSDVKDLVFPGNLQSIMNQVLSAERLAEAQLVEARTAAEKAKIESEAQLETQLGAMRVRIEAEKLAAESDAEIARLKAEADADELRLRAEGAEAYAENPALLRIRELEAVEALGTNGNARIYLGVDRHADS